MDLVYVITPAILIFVVLAAVWLDRWSVPVILVALGGGMFFGSDILQWVHFDNATLANQVANFALVFILFQGGFGIKRSDFQAVALPAGGLAVWGVLLTAGATFLVLWKLLAWPFSHACLIAAIISSTDAAATLSILHRFALPKKLSTALVLESAANDPMAVLLTTVVVNALVVGHGQGVFLLLKFAWKFAAAPVFGWLMARAALWLFNVLRPQDRGHYYVLFLGVVLLTYGVTETLRASGMLAVFIAGYVMGNDAFVHKRGVATFSSAFASIANICTFVLLGLLVFPRQWGDIWLKGLILFLVITFISRPIAVFLGTPKMGLGFKNRLFMTWAGLRGSVPIILATYPAAAGLPESQEIFNLVFFAVLLSVLVQGSTLGVCARALGLLTARTRQEPLYSLELITMAPSDMDLLVVDLPESIGTDGPRIQDLRLPPDTVITLISRGEEVISPLGATQLKGGDQITVLAHAKNSAGVRAALLGGARG
ncbi:MAG TPA: potassium/proton antiporter [Kiritimatiellia bacterium]|jgi:cell volume regulation protein A|nr:potassium/proton antiporter [Kiritimatiellia bacterium]OQC55411.1 MAG: K(+)/H(+) antiporter NhaP2 [Verrucomicrobia bacterium ADurb.Bin018]HOE00033.1 potassium/proton antiporter [Kiritimatiellia bacterium]HOE36333.1 potassium/proton antiporter [Kiritimatiellia bacterium]HOR73907.1 potassium/proton antiporter [Kiritimatiellia bacterium]